MAADTPPDKNNTTENDELGEIKTKLGFKERPGFDAILVEISYRKGPKLGLIIRNYENCVMISRLDAGSLCAEKLVVGDRLVAVDGEAAKDREQTKKIILKGFAKRKKCVFLIERPQSSEAKLWAKTAILSSSTRTSSTAPREKHKWQLMAAQQRQAARLLAAKESRTPQNETGSARSAISCNAMSASGKNDSQRKDD
uniref:PDZ domain-containing protein n=1 Tax=Panagrolaimus sp. ES5 TaxID=591445 RepID=A0AC34F625_9BILA